MKLIFNEITINQIVIDEELFKEYLDTCKNYDISPDRDDLIEWINQNVYIGDLVDNEEYKYTLTDSQFNDYLKNFNND